MPGRCPPHQERRWKGGDEGKAVDEDYRVTYLVVGSLGHGSIACGSVAIMGSWLKA